jgi:hypothetical protein
MPVDVEVVEVIEEPGAWRAWPVYWTAIWVGALASIAAAVIFGLIGIAIGAHQTGVAGQIVKWGEVPRVSVIASVLGAFLAFVVGGWVTAKIAGIRHSEPAILHGTIAWLTAIPLLLVLVAIGAGTGFGGWYGGLGGLPAWVTPTGPVDPNATITVRNSALAASTAVLLGLVGSVIGGWMASGEPMTFTYRRPDGTPMPRRTP